MINRISPWDIERKVFGS